MKIFNVIVNFLDRGSYEVEQFKVYNSGLLKTPEDIQKYMSDIDFLTGFLGEGVLVTKVLNVSVYNNK